VRYMHSDIDTLERIEIIRDLRLGAFDVLSASNLLREGLTSRMRAGRDPDADKEGFCAARPAYPDHRRAARKNVDGKCALRRPVTGSMSARMAETNAGARTARVQHRERITPESIRRASPHHGQVYERDHVLIATGARGGASRCGTSDITSRP